MSYTGQFAAYAPSGRLIEISDDKFYLRTCYPHATILPYCKVR